MEPPKAKRAKVDVACDSCRRRKIKCDGRQPVCHPCQKRTGRGTKCSWISSLERTSAQTPVGHTQWPELPSQFLNPSDPPYQFTEGHSSDTTYRVSSYQNTGEGPKSPSCTTRPDNTMSGLSHSFSPQAQSTIQATDTTGGCVADHHQRQDHAMTGEEVSPSEHSVHAIIGATLDEDCREGFFGSSSAGTFMQNVKRMVQQKVGSLSGQYSGRQLQMQNLPASGHYVIQQKPVDYALPSRRRADTLMFLYWRYVHTLYPYLDKAQMQEDYERIWQANNSISDERSYMCLINVMFALCSQIDESTPIEERRQSAHVFYLRARELLDIVDTGTVRSVQSFLLLAQYFQSTNEPHPCWIFTGLATRTAQSLGLHLAETSESVADIRTKELLRKVWYGCILMDRVVSMTYGRPCMVGPKAAATVPLPLSMDEEYLVSESLRPPRVPAQQTHSVEFYVLSLKLFEILHDVIFYFYSINFQPGQTRDGEKNFGSLDQEQHLVFEIEGKLSKWQDSVPSRLQLAAYSKPLDDDAKVVLYRQAVVLQQRQLHVRLLLLRPFLSRFIASEIQDGNRPIPLEKSLSHRVMLQCGIVCVKVALEAIEIIHREDSNKTGGGWSCAAWWYGVLYLYTAATVLIAARLAPAILADVSEEAVLNGWHRAMVILEGYAPVGASIQRLITTLRLLFDAVPEQYSRYKDLPRHNGEDTSAPVQGSSQRTVLLPFYPTLDLVSCSSIPLEGSTRDPHDNNGGLPNELLLDFDNAFDPNDLSWLMTFPFES